MQYDERERELRAARAAKQTSQEPEEEPAPPLHMPGNGHLLSGDVTPPVPMDEIE